MLNRLVTLATLLAALASPLATAQTPAEPVPAQTVPVFVVVNGQSITVAEYDQLAREAFRRKFYHGEPPEAEVQALLRDIGQQMIDRVLLQEAVEKQKIAPDVASVDKEVAGYEAQYAGSAQWAAQRQTVLPRLRGHLEAKSRLDVLEKRVKTVDASDDELLAYYEANQALFTEPEKRKVSLILLPVEPAASQETWQKASERAKELLELIRQGAAFEDTARQHSADASAARGGDMGYLHRGMLAEAIEVGIDQLKPGELGGPTPSLQGIVIYRLDDRSAPKLRRFDEVKARARELFLRGKSAKAWEDYLRELRRGANIAISPEFQSLMATPASAEKTGK